MSKVDFANVVDQFQNKETKLLEYQDKDFKPYKVFVNHVDRFFPRYLSSFLTDQVYGLSRLVKPPDASEEDLTEEPKLSDTIRKLPTDKYIVSGSLSTIYEEPSEDISSVLNEDDESFDREILNCGFIIYDITKKPDEIPKALKALSLLIKQLEDIEKLGPKTLEKFSETKNFILVSTVMTWALTKPLDSDDPDLPFSEVDYKKRRPHPNFRLHYNCEKEVIKAGQKYKNKLKTYIVCAGITYGEEEEDLDFFFKMAWYNEVIPIFGDGNHKIPFIHVADLSRAVHGLMENLPIKPQYILAVEPIPTSFAQFAKSLSKNLSNGKIVNIEKEEAFLYTNLTQSLYDKCTIDLNMEPIFLIENLQLQWQSEENIAKNMKQIVTEFKNKRNLKPVKILMHGPPASGKTTLAKKLCDFYKCKYITIDSFLDELLQKWRERFKQLTEDTADHDDEFLDEEDENEMEEKDDPQVIQEHIRELLLLRENSTTQVPDSYIIRLLKPYLASNLCQNRGYILDGYPYLTKQAQDLFKQSDNMVEIEEEDVEAVDNEKIIPNLIVSLVATDDFIRNQIMRLPENLIQNTPHSEEQLLLGLEAFHLNNTDENTVLNYFDDLEVDIVLIEVEDDNYEKELAIVVNKLGAAAAFGITDEEKVKIRQIEEEEIRLKTEKAKLEEKIAEQQAEEERKAKMELWAETFEKLKLEEEKILIAQSEPMKHYLMKYVIPTLTKGLIEVATIKPSDPIDYLAEYLFKENPERKLFDPSYNAECENLYNDLESLIGNIIDKNEPFQD